MKSLFFVITFSIILSSLNAQQNGQLENLGQNVNTTNYTECYPCLSPDGKTLYFSRDAEDGSGYDIYVSTLNDDNTWSLAQKIVELSNSVPNSVYNVSPDGNTILVKGIYGDNPSVNGISQSFRTKDGWSKPKQVIVKNVPDSWWGQHSITLSSDKQTMILSLDADIYVCFLEDDNTWSEPKKLPENINPPGLQYTPFLAPDNKTLYFSSGGHGGMGSNDIFKTTRLDDTWLKWLDPVNVGEPINTSGWESFFSISAKGDYAYIYKLDIGAGDILRLKLAESIKPEPMLLVSGKVLNSKTKEAIITNIRFENLNTGKKIGSASSNPNTGEYKIVLPSGNLYGVFAESPGFIAVNENLDLTNLATYGELTKDLFLVPIETGQTVRMNNIFFDFNKWELKSQSFPELDRIVNLMNENPLFEIEISGHTDNVGTDDANLKLSVNRANAVKQYLIGKGINATRLKAKGYGKTKPVADNNTDEGRQINRRVEFVLLKVK